MTAQERNRLLTCFSSFVDWQTDRLRYAGQLREGCPHDDFAAEPTNKALKAEFVYRNRFSMLREL
ncbi:hypothetical protein [uncultured Senegalimassilia sp.]|uniref:hypothetical protein n=1 Tax=uncultured Senegalimassilia sp. TaxID=1714350 RepID=UPI0025D061CA|nr:hypothetical protein [uncultured Senegalimassilia sp.]